MAAQTCVKAQHATLSTTVADSVTFSGHGTTLAVTNNDATTTLYCRMDGVTAVSLADDTYEILPKQTKSFQIMGSPALSVVGSGNAYSAEIY